MSIHKNVVIIVSKNTGKILFQNASNVQRIEDQFDQQSQTIQTSKSTVIPGSDIDINYRALVEKLSARFDEELAKNIDYQALLKPVIQKAPAIRISRSLQELATSLQQLASKLG